jgi:hypothetical protein
VELSPFIERYMLILTVDALGLSATRSNSFHNNARQNADNRQAERQNRKYCDHLGVFGRLAAPANPLCIAGH